MSTHDIRIDYVTTTALATIPSTFERCGLRWQRQLHSRSRARDGATRL